MDFGERQRVGAKTITAVRRGLRLRGEIGDEVISVVIALQRGAACRRCQKIL